MEEASSEVAVGMLRASSTMGLMWEGFVALCPELDIASQGASVEGGRRNLGEAVELFSETEDASEAWRRS